MSEAARSGPFWDMIEGRAPMPPVARLLGWTLLSIDPEHGKSACASRPRPISSTLPVRCRAGFSPRCSTTRWAPLPSLCSAAIASRRRLNSSFYRPAPPGPIIGFGRVAHRGRELVFLEGTLSDGEGKSLAAATSTARVIELGAFK
jgi:acyl-coenzyme A thioesterase PaaI-like protein